MPTEEQKRLALRHDGYDPDKFEYDNDLNVVEKAHSRRETLAAPSGKYNEVETGGMHFLGGIVPTGGAVAAGAAAIKGIGALPLPPIVKIPAMVAGNLLAGYGGHAATSKLQEKIMPEAATQALAQSREENPLSADVGQFASVVPFFGRDARAAGTLGNIVKRLLQGKQKTLSPNEMNAALNVAGGAGLGAGMSVAEDVMSGQDISPTRALAYGAGEAVFNNPRKWMGRLGFQQNQYDPDPVAALNRAMQDQDTVAQTKADGPKDKLPEEIQAEAPTPRPGKLPDFDTPAPAAQTVGHFKPGASKTYGRKAGPTQEDIEGRYSSTEDEVIPEILKPTQSFKKTIKDFFAQWRGVKSKEANLSADNARGQYVDKTRTITTDPATAHVQTYFHEGSHAFISDLLQRGDKRFAKKFIEAVGRSPEFRAFVEAKPKYAGKQISDDLTQHMDEFIADKGGDEAVRIVLRNEPDTWSDVYSHLKKKWTGKLDADDYTAMFSHRFFRDAPYAGDVNTTLGKAVRQQEKEDEQLMLPLDEGGSGFKEFYDEYPGEVTKSKAELDAAAKKEYHRGGRRDTVENQAKRLQEIEKSAYDTEDNIYHAPVGSRLDINDVLTGLQGNKRYGRLAKRFLNSASPQLLNKYVLPTRGVNAYEGGYTLAHELTKGHIELGENFSGNVAMHEITHALTSEKLQEALPIDGRREGGPTGADYKKWLDLYAKTGEDPVIRDLVKLYLKVVEDLGMDVKLFSPNGIANSSSHVAALDTKKGYDYGLSDIHEFLAEAMTDHRFQRRLNAVDVPEGFGSSWVKNGWDALLDVVRRMFSFEKKDMTALEAAVKVVDNLSRKPDAPLFTKRLQEIEDSPEFKKWFGDSKVVDDNGKPKRLYHGPTTAEPFDTFDPSKTRDRESARAHGMVDYLGKGVYATDDAGEAGAFSFNEGGSGARTMPLYMRLEKPFNTERQFNKQEVISFLRTATKLHGAEKVPYRDVLIQAEEGKSIYKYIADHFGGANNANAVLREYGYDGIIDVTFDMGKQYFAFDPKQVKSAIGNDGSFSKTNPDIRFQKIEDDKFFETAFQRELRTGKPFAMQPNKEGKFKADTLLARMKSRLSDKEFNLVDKEVIDKIKEQAKAGKSVSLEDITKEGGYGITKYDDISDMPEAERVYRSEFNNALHNAETVLTKHKLHKTSTDVFLYSIDNYGNRVQEAVFFLDPLESEKGVQLIVESTIKAKYARVVEEGQHAIPDRDKGKAIVLFDHMREQVASAQEELGVNIMHQPEAKNQTHWSGQFAPKDRANMPGYVEVSVQKDGSTDSSADGHKFPKGTLSHFRGYSEGDTFHVIEVQSDMERVAVEGSKEELDFVRNDIEQYKVHNRMLERNKAAYIEQTERDKLDKYYRPEWAIDDQKVIDTYVTEIANNKQHIKNQEQYIKDWNKNSANTLTRNPELENYHAIAIKAAIKHAVETGHTSIALPDAKTSMLTQGHTQELDNVTRQFKTREEAEAELKAIKQLPEVKKMKTFISMINEPTDARPTYELQLSTSVSANVAKFRHLRDPGNPEKSRGYTLSREVGHRTNYEKKLPSILNKLLGTKPTKVDFGSSKRITGDLDPAIMGADNWNVTANKWEIKPEVAKKFKEEPTLVNQKRFQEIEAGDNVAFIKSMGGKQAKQRGRDSWQFDENLVRYTVGAKSFLTNLRPHLDTIPQYKVLADEILDSEWAGHTQLDIRFHDSYQSVAGRVWKNTPYRAEIDAGYKGNTARLVKVALHELVHNGTVTKVKLYRDGRFDLLSDVDRKALTEIEMLYDYLRRLDVDTPSRSWESTAGSLNEAYGMQNLEEFLAEGFTNIGFQERLRKIDYHGGTVWSRLIKRLSNLLGIRDDNALHHLLNEGAKLLKSKSKKDPSVKRFQEIEEYNVWDRISSKLSDIKLDSWLDSRVESVRKTAGGGISQSYLADKGIEYYRKKRYYEGIWANRAAMFFDGYTPDKGSEERITRYLWQTRHKESSTVKLNEEEQKIVGLWRKHLKEIAAHHKKIGMKIQTSEGEHGKKFSREIMEDPDYSPDMIATDVIHHLVNHSAATDSRARELKDEFIGWAEMEGNMTNKEAHEYYENYIDAVSGARNIRGTSDATLFNALRQAQGLGLPFSWVEKNPIALASRYGRRVAHDFAFFEAIQADPLARWISGVVDQTGVKASEKTGYENLADNPEVRDMMFGILAGDAPRMMTDKKNQARIMATARAVSNSIMGVGTGIRDIFAMPAQASPYLTMSDLPAILKGAQNVFNVRKKALESGATQLDYDSLHYGNLEYASPDGYVKHVSRLSQLLRKWGGRQSLENFSRHLTFAIGEELAITKLAQAKAGDKKAKEWLEKFTKSVDDVEAKDTTQRIAKEFTDRVQGAYDAEGLPGLAIDGQYSPFFNLARWSIEKYNTVKTDVFGEMKKGNYGPLVNYIFGTLLSGAAVEQLNAALTGKEGHDPNIEESFLSPDADVDDYIYKIIALGQLGAFAGIGADGAKLLTSVGSGDLGYSNPISFPLYSFITESVGQNVADAVEAVQDGEDPLNVMGGLVHAIATQSNQNYRYAQAHINSDETKRKERYRDLSVWKRINDEPTGISSIRANKFLNAEAKEFKRTDDLEEAASLVPSLIQRAIEKADGDPYKLKKELQSVKSNNYQTMPSPKNMPISFASYLLHLEKTQGKEAAAARLENYFKQNAVNKAKTKMIP